MKNSFKKVIKVLIYTIITVFIVFYIFIFCYFGNSKNVDLKSINDTTKEEIISLLNLQDIENNIELIKLEKPSTYRDIYYKIYFSCDENIENIENLEKHDSYEIELAKDETNSYVCTIYKINGNSIELLENLFEGD